MSFTSTVIDDNIRPPPLFNSILKRIFDPPPLLSTLPTKNLDPHLHFDNSITVTQVV